MFRGLIALLLVGCGMDVDVKDSKHRVESKSTVDVGDSEHKVTVSTTLDKVLEVCGIVLADGTVIPYTQWNDDHKDCMESLEYKDILATLNKGSTNEDSN